MLRLHRLLPGLRRAALTGDTAAADRHYRAAAVCHRRLGARPMLAHTLHEHARLLDPAAAPAVLAEARAIAADCGMTRLLAALDQAEQPRKPGYLTLQQEDDFWLVGFADARHPGTGQPGPALPGPAHPPSRPAVAAEDLVQLAAATGPASTATSEDGLQDASGTGADEVLDQQARAAYRQRLTALDEDLAEAETWHDTEPASRLRAEKDFLVRELAAATGLGGMHAPRRGIRTRPAQRHPGHQGRYRQDPRPRPGRRRAPGPGRPDRDPLLLLPAQRVAPGCPKVPGTPPLVGRDDERDRLVAAWHAAASATRSWCSSPARRAWARPGWSTSCARTRAR